jgi:hypothetical protein
MSLHTLANHIQSAGRGEDKMLVHMTPGEVHGLQALAKAHGGSLSINPHTGLPEAGFLSSILPMVAGGLLAATGVGAPLAAAIVGGAGTLATGSLQKGLMMGLGAFGGAGLAGMAGLGAAGAAEAAAGSAAGAGTLGSAETVAAQNAANLASQSASQLGSTLPGATTAAAPAASTWSGVAPGLSTAPTASTLTTPTLAPAAQIQQTVNAVPSSMTGKLGADFKTLTGDFSRQNIGAFINEHPYATTAALGLGYSALNQQKAPAAKKEEAYIRPYDNSSYGINPNVQYYRPYSNDSTSERTYFTGGLQAQPIYRAAAGGLTALAVGGPVETMSAQNAVGQNQSYPQANLQTAMYSNPMVQRPVATNVINQGVDTNVDPYTGEEKLAGGGVARFGLGGVSAVANPQNEGYKYNYNPDTQQFTQLSAPQENSIFSLMGKAIGKITGKPQPTGGIAQPTGGIAQPIQQPAPMQQPMPQGNVPAYQTPEQQLGLEGFYNNMNQQLAQYADGGMAVGGVSHLGDYSDGGRLLRGPGDGVSDSIPASIGDHRPARLADGEFVVPARIVSEIGNGSTEAGARKLYAMMDRVQNARKKSVGKSKVAVDSKADRLLPA